MANLKKCGIIALDRSTMDEPFVCARMLVGEVWGIKTEDMTRVADAVPRYKDMGHRVFADAKTHRTGPAAADEVAALAHLGADLISVDAACGPETLMACAEAYRAENKNGLGILALGPMTSDDQDHCKWAYGGDIKTTFVKYRPTVTTCGLAGIICSPLEASLFESDPCRKDYLVVTPGIVLAGGDPGRHKRYGTPEYALKEGANLLVIGGAITRAPNRSWLKAVKGINTQIAHLP